MEANSWRSTQGEMPDGRSGDWKTQLHPEARQRIVNKIMDTLKRHLPISDSNGLNELQKIAIRFEEKIYTAAADQSDYLKRISQKMLSMEKKPQHPGGSGQINHSINQNHVDQGPSQSTISSVSQPSSIQNMTSISQNSVTNSLGQAAATNIYSTAQRQMQGRQQQQQMISQQQHQSQNQLLYQQQQFQPQLLKQKLQQSTLPQSHVQQQALLQQTTQLQSSQQPFIAVTSNLQSGHSSIQQTQPGAIQSIVQSGLSQNSISSVQQSGTSLLQQQPQSVSRQQQQPQSNMLQQTPLQHHQTSASQHSNLAMHQHQQSMCQQSNISNVQQSQLVGQQTSGTDMQQPQRLPTQQNNLLSMQQSKHLLNQQSMPLHQQQMLGTQTNISGFSLQQQQQQQQQQMLESLSNVSNLQPHQRPMHVLQQAKTVVQQQQNQQAPLAMLQAQGQPQNQSLQQQQISHIQSQTVPHQQQLVQQHIGSLQRDMQQRVPASGSILPQNAMEHQKQFVQSQMGLQEVSSSSTLDSIAPTGIVAVDLQEEIYQKVKSMKDLYFADLNEFYQWVSLKLQQNDVLPSAKAAEQFQKMNDFKKMLECILQVLKSPKANIHPSLKDKIPIYEKQILNILASNKKKGIPSQPHGQQQFQRPSSHSQLVQQQQQTQISQLQQHDNYTNQQNNIQSSSNSTQAPAVQGVQHGSVPLSAQFGVTSQQNISNALPTGSTVDPVQGNSFSSLQQGAIAPMQQGGLVSAQSSIAQQTNANIMPNASMNSSHNNAIAQQPSSNVMQQQHFKQEQQHLMSNPQLKQQLQHRHMQQHLLQQQQKQQLLQAQQPLQQQLQQQQQKQQQTSQMPLHRIQQLHQSNEVNDLRLRQAPGIKLGHYQQHYSTGQRHSYYQVKPGATVPISSPQNFQASSPQASHNSSQIDQHCQLSSQIKSGTPLQSANSPFVPSPSTPIDPSPIPCESEKQLSSFTPLPNVGHVGHQQTAIAPQSQSLAVATPGISASPLLAEFSCPDGNQTTGLNLVPGKASTPERPLKRLIELMQSLTPEAWSSAVRDIHSVVSMIDRIASSAPGNGSRAAVGEDLVAMTKCRLQARSFMSQDGSGPTKRIKRDISSIPLNNISSAGSKNDSLKQSYGLDTSELESTATSCAKQQKFEVNHALIEEIREINQWLIVTVVNISEEGTDSISAASEGEGTIVKCFFNAVALCPDLKSQFAKEDVGPILPLRLFVPSNYPKSSPVLLDKVPDEQSRESDDLSVKARSRFVIYLRSLSQPMSLGEMVKTWDACAQRVITEYAQQTGGGTFSSRHGAWENCVGA
ncbi:mediator of RNA polymerase II transcription subunit 15a-like isoform X2 [Zingiber officinale]|uniref:mediator of RNA polymerase II transcription subunit 15a-like isoform X2 n=1 Tax=Zingiber officinale TaxID=94328 RepID=UPI001C4CFD3B|nr:mediator of RNA polymerase II transcription subunit 15a-like isoform X2 [Zingiber officinale]